MYTVKKIDKKTANEIIPKIHYSKKLGIFWEGFALYENDKIIGVVCYGQPSASIQKHCFLERNFRLYELTRLVVDGGKKNAASFLISHSLKMLSQQPCAVISYADSSHGHAGIVYQSTNWIYTGGTVSHDHLYIIDGVLMHPTSVQDKFKITSVKKWAKDNNIQTIKPDIKHRYFYFIGNKKQKKEMISKLKYKIIKEYPKCEKKMYNQKYCVEEALCQGKLIFKEKDIL